jgi:hypothetical protein
MQHGHLLVEMLGQRVDLDLLVLAGLVHSSIWASVWLVKDARHDEGRVARGAAEIHQTAFGQQDDALAGRISISSTCGLMLVPDEVLAETIDLDLVIEVTDVADDGAVLHLRACGRA